MTSALAWASTAQVLAARIAATTAPGLAAEVDAVAAAPSDPAATALVAKMTQAKQRTLRDALESLLPGLNGATGAAATDLRAAANSDQARHMGILIRAIAAKAAVPAVNTRSELVSQYGSYIPQPGQVGARQPMSQLNEYNSPDTLEVTFNGPVELQDKIIYGRIANPQNIVRTENCILRGPANASRFQGETAVVDFNNPPPRGSIFLDTTVAPQFCHPQLNAFKGGRMRCERVHVWGVVDGWGPYGGSSASGDGTDVQVIASRAESLTHFPGPRYADHNTRYWDGSTWTTSGTVARNDSAGFIDSIHLDGNHCDCIEVHGGYGNLVFNPSTKRWEGDGIYIFGNSFNATDAYDLATDPGGLGIPIAGQAGARSTLFYGWGDNPKRGLPGGGQRPGMTRPITSGWTRPMFGGGYSANGAGVLFAQLTNAFPNPDTVVMHGNYFNGGGSGWHEHRKNYARIQFRSYNNYFGPGWFMWKHTGVGDAQSRDIYPIRLNSSSVDANGVRTVYSDIGGDPLTGETWDKSQFWLDPDNYWGRNGQSFVQGSGTVPGWRY